MSTLNQESGFDELTHYYNENKDKPWQEWLKITKIFPKPGKQGLVGLMSSLDDSKTYVFKISQYINYLIQHELTVMNSLNELSTFCPHYCRAVGNITCEIDPTKRKPKGDDNPFEKSSKYTIEKDVMLMEYLKHSYKFYNLIVSEKVDEAVLYSVVKQTLLAVAIAQRKKRFTHYDLHSNNVMIKSCSRNLCFLYILDENTQFFIPTRGSYPVLIDFGFSYSQDLDGQPLWPSLNHTDVGFLSDRFDPIADPKLFLVSVSDEINEERRSKSSKKLLNIAKNNYGRLKIDWDSGWDSDTKKCATDYVLKLFRPYNKCSKLFEEYEYYCIDILQTLIILPLQEQSIANLGIAYSAFLKEFSKFENEITTPFFCLYLLKGIVDSARTVRRDYVQEATKEKAVGYFKTAILERLDSISSFCRPKDVHFERMLCSLLCLGKAIEGVLFQAMTERVAKKNEWYRKVPIQTPEELCSAIEVNIEDEYELNENTSIIVIDCVKEACYPLELSLEEKEEINSYSSATKGAEVYKMLGEAEKSG